MFCFSVEKNKVAWVLARLLVCSLTCTLTIPSNHIYHFILSLPGICSRERSCFFRHRIEIKNSERKKIKWMKETWKIHCCVLSSKRKCHHQSMHSCLPSLQRAAHKSFWRARALARLCVRLAFGFTWLVCMLLYVYSYNSMNLLFVLTISEA